MIMVKCAMMESGDHSTPITNDTLEGQNKLRSIKVNGDLVKCRVSEKKKRGVSCLRISSRGSTGRQKPFKGLKLSTLKNLFRGRKIFRFNKLKKLFSKKRTTKNGVSAKLHTLDSPRVNKKTKKGTEKLKQLFLRTKGKCIKGLLTGIKRSIVSLKRKKKPSSTSEAQFRQPKPGVLIKLFRRGLLRRTFRGSQLFLRDMEADRIFAHYHRKEVQTYFEIFHSRENSKIIRMFSTDKYSQMDGLMSNINFKLYLMNKYLYFLKKNSKDHADALVYNERGNTMLGHMPIKGDSCALFPEIKKKVGKVDQLISLTYTQNAMLYKVKNLIGNIKKEAKRVKLLKRQADDLNEVIRLLVDYHKFQKAIRIMTRKNNYMNRVIRKLNKTAKESPKPAEVEVSIAEDFQVPEPKVSSDVPVPQVVVEEEASKEPEVVIEEEASKEPEVVVEEGCKDPEIEVEEASNEIEVVIEEPPKEFELEIEEEASNESEVDSEEEELLEEDTFNPEDIIVIQSKPVNLKSILKKPKQVGTQDEVNEEAENEPAVVRRVRFSDHVTYHYYYKDSDDSDCEDESEECKRSVNDIKRCDSIWPMKRQKTDLGLDETLSEAGSNSDYEEELGFCEEGQVQTAEKPQVVVLDQDDELNDVVGVYEPQYEQETEFLGTEITEDPEYMLPDGVDQFVDLEMGIVYGHRESQVETVEKHNNVEAELEYDHEDVSVEACEPLTVCESPEKEAGGQNEKPSKLQREPQSDDSTRSPSTYPTVSDVSDKSPLSSFSEYQLSTSPESCDSQLVVERMPCESNVCCEAPCKCETAYEYENHMSISVVCECERESTMSIVNYSECQFEKQERCDQQCECDCQKFNISGKPERECPTLGMASPGSEFDSQSRCELEAPVSGIIESEEPVPPVRVSDCRDSENGSDSLDSESFGGATQINNTARSQSVRLISARSDSHESIESVGISQVSNKVRLPNDESPPESSLESKETPRSLLWSGSFGTDLERIWKSQRRKMSPEYSQYYGEIPDPDSKEDERGLPKDTTEREVELYKRRVEKKANDEANKNSTCEPIEQPAVESRETETTEKSKVPLLCDYEEEEGSEKALTILDEITFTNENMFEESLEVRDDSEWDDSIEQMNLKSLCPLVRVVEQPQDNVKEVSINHEDRWSEDEIDCSWDMTEDTPSVSFRRSNLSARPSESTSAEIPWESKFPNTMFLELDVPTMVDLLSEKPHDTMIDLIKAVKNLSAKEFKINNQTSEVSPCLLKNKLSIVKKKLKLLQIRLDDMKNTVDVIERCSESIATGIDFGGFISKGVEMLLYGMAQDWDQIVVSMNELLLESRRINDMFKKVNLYSERLPLIITRLNDRVEEVRRVYMYCIIKVIDIKEFITTAKKEREKENARQVTNESGENGEVYGEPLSGTQIEKAIVIEYLIEEIEKELNNQEKNRQMARTYEKLMEVKGIY